jgi:hypothetical protein
MLGSNIDRFTSHVAATGTEATSKQALEVGQPSHSLQVPDFQ